MSSLQPAPLGSEEISQRIVVLRGQRVLIDADLARIYGVPMKRLNEQVKRNLRRFPEDFVFQLTSDEKSEVVAKCDHLKSLRFAKSLPYAFTEHGDSGGQHAQERRGDGNGCARGRAGPRVARQA